MYVVVNQAGRFYTGNWLKLKETYPFLWTPYPKQAKRYAKYGWAQQVAVKWQGQVAVLNMQTRGGVDVVNAEGQRGEAVTPLAGCVHTAEAALSFPPFVEAKGFWAKGYVDV